MVNDALLYYDFLHFIEAVIMMILVYKNYHHHKNEKKSMKCIKLDICN